MREIPGFVISGAPRTKKNSSRVVTIPRKGSRRCRACGHIAGFTKVLPSEAHGLWLEFALQQSLGIKAELRKRGVELPIAGVLSVEALVYRQQNSGDACGFYQAIGDFLQEAGIIADDEQIEDWDGSRRLKDAAKPRIEIYLTVVNERAVQMEMETAACVT